jgi:hypothetical protein
MDDITKAKALFTSVRTQVNDADTFTQNESTKIDAALNSVSNSVTFTGTAFNTINDMVNQTLDMNLTTVSRLVGGSATTTNDRNITVTKGDTSSGNVVWNYTIKDVNDTTNLWNGSLTYVGVGDSATFDPATFNPSNFTTLSANLTGTMPIDFYGATIPTGKTNSQSVDANVAITKTTNGAAFKIDGTITNNSDSVKITDANLAVAYTVDTNTTTQPKYIELQNLYVNGTVGDYTLDGKFDVKSYAVNVINEVKGFDPKTNYYWFGMQAECDNNSTLQVSDVTYDGVSAYSNGSNSFTNNGTMTSYYWFSWWDMTSAPANAGVANSYTGLVCSDNSIPTISNPYKDYWTDDNLENSGHYPSEITFDGTLTNTVASTSLNANIDAKWTNIVDANLSAANYVPNLDISVNGKLTMPESAVMNVGLTYKNTGTSRSANVTYVNDGVSITANTAFSDDNGTKTINLSSTAGINATIKLNGDNTVDYGNSTVTNTAGDTVGTIENFSGTPRVKYADGTFDSLF